MRKLARADRREREELARWVAGIPSSPEGLEALARSYAALDPSRRSELLAMLESACRDHGVDPNPTFDALRSVTANVPSRRPAVVVAYEETPTGAIVLHDDHQQSALVAAIDHDGQPRIEVRGIVVPGALAEIPLDDAIERAARIVLRHVRAGGALPPGASRFAHLFGL